MADQTIVCNSQPGGGSCYSVSNDGVSIGRGQNFVLAGPVGTLITWDASNPSTLPNKTIQQNGQATWGIPANAATGTYYYTPTNTGCDTQCGSTDKPSMKVT
jgi:hypothetical protein